MPVSIKRYKLITNIIFFSARNLTGTREKRTQNHLVISFRLRKFRAKYKKRKRKKHAKIYFEVLLHIAKEFYGQQCHFITVPVRISAVKVSADLVSVGLGMDQLNVAALEEKRMNCWEISYTHCWPRAQLCLAIFFCIVAFMLIATFAMCPVFVW